MSALSVSVKHHKSPAYFVCQPVENRALWRCGKCLRGLLFAEKYDRCRVCSAVVVYIERDGEMIEREQKWDEQKRDAALAAVSPPPGAAAERAEFHWNEAAHQKLQQVADAHDITDRQNLLREAIALLKESHGEPAAERHKAHMDAGVFDDKRCEVCNPAKRAGEAVWTARKDTSGLPEWNSPQMDEWQSAICWTTERLAELLGVTEYDADAGSETVEGDTKAILWNVLRAAGLVDEETGELRRALATLPERAGEAVAWMTGDGFPVGLDEAGDRKGGYPLYGQPNEQIEMYKHLVAQLKRELAIAKAPDASPAPAPEEGYVRVPREPTEAMCDAAHDLMRALEGTASVDDIYRAMIAERPQP